MNYYNIDFAKAVFSGRQLVAVFPLSEAEHLYPVRPVLASGAGSLARPREASDTDGEDGDEENVEFEIESRTVLDSLFLADAFA